MKFAVLSLPTIPASPKERERLRPIAHRTDKWQQMIDENVELAQMLDDYGWDAYTFPEHELHTEGLEIGFSIALGMHILDRTKRIKVGPIGYVLPTWNPIRLAVETAWLDQLSKGRTIVGFARGYQHRWFNLHGQHLGVQVATSAGDEQDQFNRRVFQEVFRILKLAWSEEAFSYDGEFYKVPFPYEGCPWPPYEMTATMGAPGEMGEEIYGDRLLHKISVVPKPYQKPHPKLFQAFSLSEATARWCARESICPVMLISYPESARKNALAHYEEAQKAGRTDVREPGNDMGALRQIYIANSREEALELADRGLAGYGWRTFWGHYGFYEAFRLPGQEGEIPWTLDQMEKAHYLYAGTVDDIKRKLEEMVKACNPEWLVWWIDQGFLPLPVVKRQLEIFSEKIMPEFKG
jgi:alkanesulfonate monooxygenase SsuD/methylene tetrahydromethanopterin reductase-like flavin-dependent oxidoreductase (luciferase family)